MMAKVDTEVRLRDDDMAIQNRCPTITTNNIHGISPWALVVAALALLLAAIIGGVYWALVFPPTIQSRRRSLPAPVPKRDFSIGFSTREATVNESTKKYVYRFTLGLFAFTALPESSGSTERCEGMQMRRVLLLRQRLRESLRKSKITGVNPCRPSLRSLKHPSVGRVPQDRNRHVRRGWRGGRSRAIPTIRRSPGDAAWRHDDEQVDGSGCCEESG